MSLISIFILAIGLSMDAFAASICQGLQIKENNIKNTLSIGLCFGIFQALMPIIGYFLASNFANSIKAIDHWVAFILLFIIGFQMIRESKDASCEISHGLSLKSLFSLGIATSIDAMAVGVSFAFLNVNIFSSSTIIGITTFILSSIAFKIGNKLGMKSKQISELIGGVILILLGTKILIEHLFLQ
ncbi:manganese efflux pump MntP family protein [Anaerococcus vaginalis]|uniref:manganese efflux pump MntP n=1 Tax=Anaerococcus vaginalis TaxID=33037 RepID=UPI00290E7DA9|nr:manganese efflux pump MntP family protein [Anaerococcus vaginalis]MDU5252013.1 manganese efflux pump MntP family protein [Anaerococcus vaginalis]MDU6781224.1 manganese efflux pump MntP family protein [Anaerococcus vaginalis]